MTAQRRGTRARTTLIALALATLGLLTASCRSALPVGGEGGEGGDPAVGGAVGGLAGAGPAGGAPSAGGATGAGGSALGGELGMAGFPETDNCGEPGVCGLVECAPPQGIGTHVTTCSEIEPSTNPPTSGPHYPIWARFGIYDRPIPDGFFIHSLEHSSVALLYDCAAAASVGLDCDELRASLEQFYADYPEDPLCTDLPHRLIVAPRPGLGAPFAVAAWGYYLRGSCFDRDRVRAFVDAHYGRNYENICNTGVDPFAQGCSEN